MEPDSHTKKNEERLSHTMSWCCTVGKSVAKGQYEDVTDKEGTESDIEARLSHTHQLWSIIAP